MMSEEPSKSTRISPIYRAGPGDESTTLYESKIPISQGTQEVSASVRIIQHWDTLQLWWEANGSDFKDFRIGEIELRLPKNQLLNGRVFSASVNRLEGVILGQAFLGTDYPVDRVTFHLPNYPDLHFKSVGTGTEDNSETQENTWPEIVLVANEWMIRLQPMENIGDRLSGAQMAQRPVLSGVGELTRRDGAQFKRQDTLKLFDAVSMFLTFAFGNPSPVLLAVGANQVSQKSFTFIRHHNIDPPELPKGWLRPDRAADLPDAFPGFIDLWDNQHWQDSTRLAVMWIVEMSRRHNRNDVRLAFCQIPLEMLAWMVFVDGNKILDSKEFDRLSAASKIHLLLTRCRIPVKIPETLDSLTTLAKDKSLTGPQVITLIRNTIVHPNSENRKKQQGWNADSGQEIDKVYNEAFELFREYTTLVLLNLMDYSGDYWHHYKRRNGFLEWDQVPWVFDHKPTGFSTG
jgi:hypothetical protein